MQKQTKKNNETTKTGSAFSGHNGFNKETFTHPKIKMEPEKWWLEECVSFWTGFFIKDMQIFGWVFV